MKTRTNTDIYFSLKIHLFCIRLSSSHSRMQEVAYVFSLLYGPTDKSGADFEYRRRNCPHILR